jgi:hypothetical protein
MIRCAVRRQLIRDGVDGEAAVRDAVRVASHDRAEEVGGYPDRVYDTVAILQACDIAAMTRETMAAVIIVSN